MRTSGYEAGSARGRLAGLSALAVAVAGLAAAAPAASAGHGIPAPVTSGAVSATEIGATAVVAPDARSALALPGASPRRGTLGAHRIYPLPVYFSGDRPAAIPQADVDAVVTAADDYWSTASGGKITLDSGWDVPAWQKLDLTASQVASCDRKAIHDAVRRKVGSAGERDHLVVILNDVPQCTFTDLETFGLSAMGDGYSIVNGDLTTPVALRALAHNGGVAGAGSLNCVNGTTPAPISGSCAKSDSYNNPWDPAASQPYDRVGTPLADSLATLGVLSSSDFPSIQPGPAKTVTLTPLSSGAGQRGVWFDLGTYRYLIDYRTPTGLDAWIDDQAWTGPTGQLADPGGGVTVHRVDLSAAPIDRARMVIDFHPDATVSDTGRHPGLASGESYASPDGSFAISVSAQSSTSATLTVSFPGLEKVDRLSGPDRYSTSATISADTYGSDVDVAYVASGEVYTDALSGAPVAGMTDGPVLLVGQDAIPSVIASELRRLNPGRIVIFGGPATITPRVEQELGDYSRGSVVRWSGADRFETSAAISQATYSPDVKVAYVASGRVFTDALSGAPVAGKSDGPVLLVDTDKIPPSIATELDRLNPDKIVVFGGANTITEQVRTALAGFTEGTVDRWWGADRFSTSAQIVTNAYAPNGGTVYIASGRVFTDALSGAPAAGSLEAPVLLVDTDKIPDTVAAELRRLRPAKIVVLGGPNTISYGVQAGLGAFVS